MKKRIAPEGVVMTLTLPSLAGLILLLLARLDSPLHETDNFQDTFSVVVYLGIATSLIALGLSLKGRTDSTATTKICFVLNLAWIFYSCLMLPAVWVFSKK